MRITYGMVKEHAAAIEKGITEIDPEQNPFIDPRSVSEAISSKTKVEI